MAARHSLLDMHGGAAPPAGRHVEPGLPERVLVLVVDDDDEGFRRRLSRLVHGSH